LKAEELKSKYSAKDKFSRGGGGERGRTNGYCRGYAYYAVG